MIFLACALELQGYYQNPDKFISRLPILLDATCNGLQHLSAIANDINLAEKVNICASQDDDKPQDVYSELILPIKRDIAEFVKSNPEHYNLTKLNITRKFIKRSIMTITYGVTIKGILDQLEKEFFSKPNLINKQYIFKAKDIFLSEATFSRENLYILSSIIYKILFKMHPILEEIMIYFQSMVKLLNQLEIPVTWITPSGLVLSQRYSRFTTYDITSVIQSKRRKITLSKPELDVNKKIKLNSIKQINAFVPNFIHSMDASNVILLIKEVNKKHKFDVLTIHDCFATQANTADILSHLVKEAFISIYSKNQCINNFHIHVISNIKSIYTTNMVYDRSAKCYIITKNKENYYSPKKPKLGKMDLRKELINSNYFIN